MNKFIALAKACGLWFSTNNPLMPCWIISFGPLSQSTEITGVPAAKDSINDIGKPSYRLVKTVALACWMKGKTSAKILDAGSGFGQYSFYMAKKSQQFSIDAVDVKLIDEFGTQ